MRNSLLGSGSRTPANRQQRRLDAKQRRADAKLVFEALEPRVLLSADPLSVTLGGDAAHPLAHDVIIEQVTQTLSSVDHTTVAMVQVVEQGPTPTVLASMPAANVSAINVTSGTGDTNLTVDTASFGKAAPPPITFTGGNGDNTLTVTGGNETDWNITGANSGAVTGSVSVAFTGVSNLTGGMNANVFTVQQAGSLSGTLDGGPGVNGTLMFNNYGATNAIYSAAGPHSGTVSLDGSVFTYADLAPIIFNGNAANVTVSGTGQLALGDTSTPGQIEIQSLNNSMENVIFTDPTASLTVDMTGATDSLAISTLHLPGASLTASGAGADGITVDPGAYVSTRATFGDALNAPSFADFGDLSLTAQTIAVSTGSFLYANANSGFNAGDITLDATATGTAGQPAVAALAVHGAQVVGGIISIDSSAGASATVNQQTTATLSLNASATTTVDGAGFIASTVGDVDIGSNVFVDGQVTATAAPLGSLNADAAVALADVNASATTTISGTSLLGAVDTLSVRSANLTTVTTLADGTTGGASAVGGSVALSDVTTSSQASLGAGVHAFANQLDLGADSATTVSTTANATAGGATANGAQGMGALGNAATPDGQVAVAAAIAGTTMNDTDSAIMGASGVGTAQGLNIDADASRLVTTFANASSVQGGTGVGAAVALNALSAGSTAELAGPVAIGGDVSIGIGQLRTPDVFGAVALSGAGATGAGVAGALAVNGVSDDAFGGIAAGADVTLVSGGITVNVVQTGGAVTDALAFLQGATSGPGVGASVAIAPVHFSATAGVQAGATLDVGDPSSAVERDASFMVTATRTIDTTADGGTAGGTGTAAALALTAGQNDASAELDAGAAVTVQGNLTLTANQSSDVHTTGQAESGARATVVAFGIDLDDTRATTAATVTAAGTVRLDATGATDSTTLATAGPLGAASATLSAPQLIAAELGFLNNPAGVTLSAPASADGSFGIAAAMAMSVVIGRVGATIEPAAGAPESVTANDIFVNARGSTAAATRADASSVMAGGGANGGFITPGIGAALALQTGQANILAEDDAPISANIISLSASSPGGDVPENAGDFTVQAIAGAGAQSVGVAGAMAIGGDGINVRAVLNGAATATTSVSLSAGGRSVSSVDATAVGAGQQIGVGASFSLDVADATVAATIADGGSVAGLPALTMTVNGGQNATTTAEGGAAGGTATGADFALAVVTDEISANLTSGATARTAQTLLQATGASTATTTATGGGASANTAIGSSLALGIVIDKVIASIAGELIADGAITMTATGTSAQTTTANAGERGAASTGVGAGSLLANQLAFLSDPAGIVEPGFATANGALGVAAALSFGVDDATAQAIITGRVGSLDTLTMTATGGIDAGSTASGAAVDEGLGGTGVAIAAAVMIGTPTISARIDGVVLARGTTLTAATGTPTGHEISSHAISGVGGDDTGVAGAFALTVAAPVTEAAIGATGRLDDLGHDATLSATGASDESATAAAANLGSGQFGLGASVALDIGTDDTHARLENGARVTDTVNLSLEADGTVDTAAHALAGSESGGIGGAVAINVAPQDTRAEIDPGDALTITGDLLLRAIQSQTSIANASGGVSGRGGEFGAAIAVNAPVATTGAALNRGFTAGGGIQILAGSTSSATAQATAGDDGAPTADTADQEVANWLGAADTDGSATPSVVPSIGGAVSGASQLLGLTLPGIGGAAALAVDAAFGSTTTEIGGGAAIIAGGDVTARSVGDSQANARADASAITGPGAAGIAIGVNFDAQSLDASIGANTPVTGQTVTVEALVTHGGTQLATADAMAGANAAAGVAGAIALNVLDNQTEALILDTSLIAAPDSILVDALGGTTTDAQAGYEDLNAVGGSGIALACNLGVDHTEASVMAGAWLDSLGVIDISATGSQVLSSLAEGTAAAGVGVVPASITADVILATTTTSIGKGARVDMDTPNATSAQRVDVQSIDATTLLASAGSLGISGLVGAGAAAQFSDLLKQTTADIDGTVRSAGDVIVEADSNETGLTSASAGDVSGIVTVAGSAGVQMGQLLTHAAIDGDATVHAIGDVAVTASDTTEMDVMAGNFDGSLVVAAGAGVGAVALTKTTEALVDPNATVDADGQGAGTSVATGENVQFVPGSPAAGEVGKPFLPNELLKIFGVLTDNPIHTLLSPVAASPVVWFTTEYGSVTPVMTTVHGLAITALSNDNLAVDTEGLSASGLAAVELSASGIVSHATTQAEIGAGASINQNGYPASASQEVLVNASSEHQAMVIAGTVPIGGLAAVGPSADLIAMAPVNQALIGAGAMVSAADGVDVQAISENDLLTDATDMVAGLLGVGGSAGAIIVDGKTYAYIDANAVVTAGGSVGLFASDTSNSQNVSGALDPGLSAVAAGGSAAVSLVGNDVEAWIGTDAKVSSLGAPGEADIGIDTNPADGGGLIDVFGVVVAANENALVIDLAANGSGGTAAFIGSATGVVIANTTAAFVADGAVVTAGVFDAQGLPVKGAPAKAISIGAWDSTENWDGAASVVDASLAVSGAMDAGIVRDTTTVSIDQGAFLHTTNDILIGAISGENVNSIVGGLGLTNGGVELDVSASVYSIGAVVPGDLLDALASVGGLTPLGGYLDGLLQGMVDTAGNGIVGLLNKYATGVGGQQAAATQLANLTPTSPVTGAMTATSAGTAGTTTTVTDARLLAFGDVDIGAADTVTAALDTSFTFSLNTGSGQSYNLALDGGLLAGRANATVLVTGDSNVLAAGDINIIGDATTNQAVNSTFAFDNSTSNASALVDGSRLTALGAINVDANMNGTNKYSGLMPGFSGLKIRTSENHEFDTTIASIDDKSIILAKGAVTVSASANESDNVKADGATLLSSGFQGKVTLGVALAWNDIEDTTSATITDSHVLASSIDVNASDTNSDFTFTVGAADGSNNNVAIGGSASRNILADVVSATIEGSLITAPAGVDVEATDNSNMLAVAGAAVARTDVGIGGAVSVNTITDQVTAEIGDSEIDAVGLNSGGIQVIAHGTATMSALAAGFAQASTVAVGAGLPVNNLGMDIEADVVSGSTLTTDGAVNVDATGDGTIRALAGGIAIATGQFGFGAALAISNDTETVATEVSESEITALGAVGVESLADPEVQALAIGFAYAPTVALGGSVSINNVNDTVSASVDNGGGSFSSITSHTGSITVSATDNPSIYELTGAGGASAGQVSISGSVSDNNEGDTVNVTVSGATLTAPGGSIMLQGAASPQILSLAIAGSGSTGYSGAGAISLNTISSTMSVTVGDVEAKLRAPTVTVEGTDGAEIKSLALGLGGATTAALDGSGAGNTISGGMTVDLDQNGLIQAQSATVIAANTSEVEVITGAANGAGTFAGGAAISTNKITDYAIAEVVGGEIDASSVDVSSEQGGLIKALAAMGGGAGTVAADAAVTTNNIWDSATASVISGATIATGTGGQFTETATTDSEIDSFAGAVDGAGTAGLQGAVAYNNISDMNGIPEGATAQLDDTTVTGGSASVAAADNDQINTYAVGASGAGTVALGASVAYTTADAWADSYAQDNKINLSGAFSVDSTDTSNIQSIAGSAEGAGTVAGGVAVSINVLTNEITATLEGGKTFAGSVSVTATNMAAIEALAAVGTGAGTVAGSVSVTTNVISGTVSASITDAAKVTSTGAVDVSATDQSGIESLSGAASGAGTVGGGGAYARNRIGEVSGDTETQEPYDPTTEPPPASTTASIHGGSHVGGTSVSVGGSFTGSIKSAAIAGGFGGTVGIAGALTDNLIADLVTGTIAGATTRVFAVGQNAAGSVEISATNAANISSIAGSPAGAGAVAGGASGAVNKLRNSAVALIDGATVWSLFSSVSVDGGAGGMITTGAVSGAIGTTVALDAAVTINDLQNVVTAEADDGASIVAGQGIDFDATDGGTIQSAAAAAAASGTLALSGAVATNEIADQVTARATGVTLNSLRGSISLETSETASIESLSFALSGGSVGASATVSINEIDNDLTAAIDASSVTAAGNVSVDSTDASGIESLATQFGLGAVAGVGGAAAYNEVENTVATTIDSNSNVTATNGDVTLDSEEGATAQTLAAGADAAFAAGIGGSVSVSIIANNVSATIANATVTANGNLGVIAGNNDGITAYGGQASGGIVGVAASVAVLTLESQTTASIENSTVAALGKTPALEAPDIDGTNGNATQDLETGVVVDARDLESATIKALTAAGGIVAIPATVADIHTATLTDAHIANSQVNAANKPGSGVFVHASQATNTSGTIGTIAGGIAAIGAAVQITTIDNTTRAYIEGTPGGDGHPAVAADVYANTINVSTNTYEYASITTIGLAGGLAGISGTVGYTDIQSSSDAYVRDALLDARNGAAGISVVAHDNANISTTVVNVDVGFVGVGAAVDVSTIDDTTEATLLGATLNANGAIVVDAGSDGTIDDKAGGGSGGFVGVAASILVDHIDSDTEASTQEYAGQATLINQDPSYGGHVRGTTSQQSVTVEANGNQSISGTVGAAGAGFVGAGAAIQVGGIDDRVAATVGDGTLINAGANITVNAADQRDMSSTTIAGSGGAVALSGAFAILSIGGAFDPATTNEVNQGSGSNASDLGSSVNDNLDQVSGTGLINSGDGQVAKDAKGQFAPTAPQTVDPLAAGSSVSGAFATVGSSGPGGAPRLTAGGNITVAASNSYTFSATSGSGSGGIVSLGISVGLVNVTETTIADVTGGAVLSAGGVVEVSATDTTPQPATVTDTTGQGGGLAIGGAVGDASVHLTVAAGLDSGVTVTKASDVDINTVQAATVTTTGLDVSVGVAGIGAVVNSTVIDGTVTASVGQGDHLGSAAAPIGQLEIAATGGDDGVSETTAGSGGVIAGAVNSASATVSPTFSATLGDQTVSYVATNADILAQTTGVAQTTSDGVSIGAGALALSNADSELDMSADASIGQNARVTAGGGVSVSANHTTTASMQGGFTAGVTAGAQSSGGGGIDGNGATATAKDNGSSEASVGAGTNIQAGGEVSILSTTVNNAGANANTLSIGFAAIGGQVATADADGSATAELGDDTTVHAFGLEVEAAGNGASQSNSVAAAGGVLGTSVGADADADFSPAVNALIDLGASVVALNTVDVIAVAEPSANATVDGTSISGIYAGGSSNANATGTPVVNAEIGQGAQVRAGGGVQIMADSPKIGEIATGAFNAANPVVTDLTKNEFILTGPTLLQTGDQVIYEANGGTPIGGLTSGRTYNVINDGNGISLGQTFTGAQVNLAQGTIQFAAPDGFMTGDRVVYSSNGGTAIGGLVNGQTYYVRVINPTTIKLATSLQGAELSGFSFNAALIATSGLITMANNGFTNGDAITYRSTGNSVAGLVNGDTYFVIRLNANQFWLAGLPGGPALAISDGSASGVQTLGSEGVAIDGSGIFDVQSLTFDLTSHGTGTQNLVGVGGAAAGLPATPSDAFNASATASGGALDGDIGSQTVVTVNGTTTASEDGNATVTSGGAVLINASDARPSEADATGDGSGGIGLGSGTATTTDNETTSATVSAGASLAAGLDVTIVASGEDDANGMSQSTGGGAIKSSDANMYINIDPETNVMVGHDAHISAANGDVDLNAQDTVGGDAQSAAGGLGVVGSGSNANSFFTVGAQSGGQVNASILGITVGANATVSGANILANAAFIGFQPSANSYAISKGTVVLPSATSVLDLNTSAQVQIDANAKLTASNQVNLLADYGGGGDFTASAITDRSGLVGSQNPLVTDTQHLASVIDVAPGATITAHEMQLSVTVGASTPNLSAQSDGGSTNHPEDVQETSTENRTIIFDGNADILAGPAPLLVVNEFGQIVDARGVTASVGGGAVTVQPIADTGSGTASFSSDAGTQYSPGQNGPIGAQEASFLSGTGDTITFENTFRTVTLENGSALNMVVNGIDPVVRTPGAAINLQLDNLAGFSVALAEAFGPTTIIAVNSALAGIGNLVLAGDIEDPIGTIGLGAAGGNIVAQGKNELVRGASVTLNAGGSIGTAAQLLAVQLVDSAQMPITFNATAGGDIDVSVLARLRDPSAFVFTPTLGNLIAGGSIDLDLQSAVRDSTVTGPDYHVAVYTQSPTYGLSGMTYNNNAWSHDTGGAPPLPPGIFATGSTPYSATYTIGLLQAGGQITVTDPGAATVGLVANTQLAAGNSISVAVSGDVSLTELTGDLRVGDIAAGGSVSLKALAGSILDTSPGGGAQPSAIKATDISLTALNGSIGTLNNALDIELLGGATGLTALARQGIDILEVGGDLLLNSVDAGGDIILGTTAGSIRVATGAASPQVVGHTIALTAKAGGIATAAAPLKVHTTAANGLTDTSTRPAYVQQVADNMLLEAGLGWSLGDGGTSSGKVKWTNQV